MRTRIKQFLLLAGVLGITLILSGCFFSEQTLVIGPDGKADVKVEFWFDKIQAGDQGYIAMQELLYLFPELQDYEMTRTEKRIEYTTYIVYSFQADGVDINKNQYIDFEKKDDGSYSLMIRIPKTIEEKKEKNDKILTVRVMMPTEIDMANTIDYDDWYASWDLRTNDFTRDITLRVSTKTTAQQIESLRYDDPVGIAYEFVWAVENDDLEIAYKCWKDEKLAKEAAQALKQKEWGEPIGIVTVHHVFKISPEEVSIQTGPFLPTEEYLILVPYWDDGLAQYQIKSFNDRWLITSQTLSTD